MERVLIVGISSFVGANLAFSLRQHFRVLGTYSQNHPRLDNIQPFHFHLTPGCHIPELIKMTQPDAVIYCAAKIDNKDCENHPAEALFVNSEAPYQFALAMREFGGRMIYLSTSKVFLGDEGDYSEEDEARPQNLYASMKVRGEEQLRDFENLFILRLGTIFGLGSSKQKTSILNRFLDDLWSDKSVSLIADEMRSFVSAQEVGRAVHGVLQTNSENAGLYHLAHAEKHSYFTFGKELVEVFGIENAKLNPIQGSDFGGEMAQSGGARGNDLTLDGSLFEKTFGIKLHGVVPSLLAIRNGLRSGQF